MYFGAKRTKSALAERFCDLVGEPPMHDLTKWRLALASRALRGANVPIAQIADDAGYESEAAFTRAFEREFGMPPGRGEKLPNAARRFRPRRTHLR
jgi:AraC-like DNA-binding protein